MARRLPWTLAFQLAAFLPLLVPHYVLGTFAIMGPKGLMWPTLALDALLVGYLTPVIIASTYYAATRAADLAGVSLLSNRHGAGLIFHGSDRAGGHEHGANI
jgi:hypothetical protein